MIDEVVGRWEGGVEKKKRKEKKERKGEEASACYDDDAVDASDAVLRCHAPRSHREREPE